MSNGPNVEACKQQLMLGGGAEGIEAQHKNGKMTARERIAAIVDADSFVETDVFLGGCSGGAAAAEGVVAGFGTVSGRPVYLYAQDYTVLSGAIGEKNSKKICKVMDLAVKTGVPILSIIDSAGARLGEGIASLAGYGEIYKRATRASGVVPQVSIVCGPCVGAAAIAASLSDFVFAVDKISYMSVSGPQVTAAYLGKPLTVEQIGGSETASKAGIVDFSYADEASCFSAVKLLLDYLPANNLEDAPITADAQENDTQALSAYSESRDIYGVINAVADGGAFLEYDAGFAPNMVTGFAHMNGRSVGIVANRYAYEGAALSIDACDKAAKFVSLCDSFSLPIVTLVDTEGLPISMEQHKAGLIRHAAKLVYSYAESTVPKVTVIIGKAIGSGYNIMASKAIGGDMVYAWYDAEIAPVDADTGAVILYDAEIAASNDPIAARAEYTEKFRVENAGPIQAAGSGYVDDIIEPAVTRSAIAAALEILAGKREEVFPKKHGNYPI